MYYTGLFSTSYLIIQIPRQSCKGNFSYKKKIVKMKRTGFASFIHSLGSHLTEGFTVGLQVILLWPRITPLDGQMNVVF